MGPKLFKYRPNEEQDYKKKFTRDSIRKEIEN